MNETLNELRLECQKSTGYDHDTVGRRTVDSTREGRRRGL